MLDRSPPAWVALGLVVASAAIACTPTPTVAPALDKVGLYCKVDGASATSGFAQAPAPQWPPQLLASEQPATGPGCRDDKTRIESELGLESTACPVLQAVSDTPTSADADQPIGDADQPIGDADAPIGGDADAPIAAPQPAANDAPKPIGANLTCYDLGPAMLVAKFTYYATTCTQLVDLGMFHKR